MEEREIAALNIIWEMARRTGGTFRDISLRLDKSMKAMKDLSKTYPACKAAYDLMTVFKKAFSRARDTIKKIEELAKNVNKLEKMGIDAGVAQFKKWEADIKALDAPAGRLLIWMRREWEKEKGMLDALRADQTPVPPDVSIFLASVKRHMGNRSGLTKGFHDFRALAR